MKTQSKSIVFIAVILFGSSIYMAGHFLSLPSPAEIGDIPVSLKGDNVKFFSKTGRPLSGWLIPGNHDFGGILLMHGVRSNRKQMIDRAVFLKETGYTILLFDFQAHGESPGDNVTFGYLESKDAEAAFTYLKNQLTKKTIGVIGVSLGGAAAILGDVSVRADALVLESVYSTLRKAVQNRMSIHLGKFGLYLSPLISWQIEPRLGFNPNQLSPIESLSKINIPILIIAGTEDEHTTFDESRYMYNAALGPKEFWAVKGAGHQDFLKYSPDLYKKTISEYFERHL